MTNSLKLGKKIRPIIQSIIIILLFGSFNPKKEYTIGNKFISRTVTTDKFLKTTSIVNKLTGKIIRPVNNDEFRLRISKNDNFDKRFFVLTAKDFTIKNISNFSNGSINGIKVELYNNAIGINLTVFYELKKNSSFIHKYIKINPKNNILLERVDIEVIDVSDIYQPYTIKQITTYGKEKWKPGLGQPIFTRSSGFFMGTEFPASYNYVENNTGICGYHWGQYLKKDKDFVSYKSVIGVGKTSNLIQTAFFDYINQIRKRPLRLQLQYNTWFDYGSDINKENFYKSITTINNELIKKRGIAQLNNYVIDDGWEDIDTDWSDTVYKVNNKFDPDFLYSLSKLKDINSNLGLWMSPGCLFGAKKMVPKLKTQGFEALDHYMSMAGPKYMKLLEERMIALTKTGVTFYKLDGIFGNNTFREFDTNTYIDRIPSMAVFKKYNLKPSSKKLNREKFDELKMYYLVEGTQKLLDIFKKLDDINPDIYILLSNGAYLSPWWLMYVDALWLINAKADASDKEGITNKLVFKDQIYYQTFQIENTQFPLNSIFNHEPKIVNQWKSNDELKKYIWMSLSRGTGLIDLYLKTSVLSEKEWDLLAEGLKWVNKTLPAFKNSTMHGGNPKEGEIYGYTGWHENGGYISVFNPSKRGATYEIILDNKIGVPENKGLFICSSKLNSTDKIIGKKFKYGDKLKIYLNPEEVKVFDFSNQ